MLSMAIISINLAELVGLLGILITLIGVWLHWRLSDWLAGLEEDLKDGKLTPRQFAQSVRRAQWLPMLFTLTGVCLLVSAVYRYLA